MAKITQNQISLIVKAFSNMLISISNQEIINLIMSDLNEAMQDIFDDAKTNGYMFGFGKYDCHIIADRFRKNIKVSYHRRWKPRYKPGQSNPWKLVYSHDLEFDIFCYNYCNPNIIHIIEKILFKNM